MGVRTTATEKRDEAKEALRTAALALSEIVVNHCWGHDEFSEEYTGTLRKGMLDLLSGQAVEGRRAFPGAECAYRVG